MAVDKLVDSVQLDADLTSVADAIRAKTGGTAKLAFPADFVNEIGSISGGGGQPIYTSSTGLLYTPVMTIDASMERTNGFTVDDVFTRYGQMPYIEELTLVGTIRNTSAGTLCSTNGMFSQTKFPILKKLHIMPDECRTGSGGTTENQYFKFGHYVFTGTNLTELTLGKLGGPYYTTGGYFRQSDLPNPPGPNGNAVGSEDGLTIKMYTDSYKSAAGFIGSIAPTTTVIQYDYLTGEVLTE